ncbi:serine/threonine protein kinase [Deinococcus cavernae]|uniref:Serine/threonine protein kinase n=1 Tax=Deinococcus cavernae TaxID=2320857 RepID=A0A418VAP0_9DEIO|nr:serine/threonine-protein kinase [Deinococcus cavernae]RJF73163.1 serine/threonine protein kinase [Deinococcus cavernae]
MSTLSPIPHQQVDRLTPLRQRGGVQTAQGVWQGQAVFVKSLISGDPEIVDRFQHEGEVAAYLQHPNIVRLLAVTNTQLIFKFIRGGTLRDLARCGPMTPDAATAVVWGVLQAAAYLHARGVVHQDLKPENVMLLNGEANDASVRIMDFGMSHARHLHLDIHSGTRMGTPHFMAPEQFQGVRGDPRSDLYSVGVLLFDCLAGHPPYEDALGWLAGICENCAELPGPPELHPLMQGAIQRDRAERPQSAQVMLKALGQARRALGLSDLGHDEPENGNQEYSDRQAAQ